jgi:hypothetical protein
LLPFMVARLPFMVARPPFMVARPPFMVAGLPLANPGGGPELLALRPWLLLGTDAWLLQLLLLVVVQPLATAWPLAAAAAVVLLWLLHMMPWRDWLTGCSRPEGRQRRQHTQNGPCHALCKFQAVSR